MENAREGAASTTSGASNAVSTKKEKVRVNNANRDELALEAAKRFYEWEDNGKLVNNQSGVAEDLNIDTHAAGELLKYARVNKLIHIRTSGPYEAHVDEELSIRLKEGFPNLHEAIVVQVPSRVRDLNSDNSDPRTEKSSEIHLYLGQVMGENLFTNAVIRSGDLIGVGSGRGSYYTCKSFQFLTGTTFFQTPHGARPRRLARLRIQCLTGRCGIVERWKDPFSDSSMDAPDVANELARGVTDPTLHIVSSSILDGSSTLLSLEKWESRPEKVPNIVIAGIGRLGDGHRFLDPACLEVKPIREQLEQLRASSEYPIGDICNRLFVAAPDDKIPQPVKNLIEEINSRLLTVTGEHLSMVENTYLIAGGSHKSECITHLLQKEPFMSTSRCTLCTDIECAEEMLKL